MTDLAHVIKLDPTLLFVCSQQSLERYMKRWTTPSKLLMYEINQPNTQLMENCWKAKFVVLH
jgi:hypothetical protein